MARPGKQGLDYFPLDVYPDRKLKFIKAKFGWEGYGIVIGLFQHIYGQGYWCSWSGDDDFLYAEENRIDRALLIEIINEAMERGLFSKELYQCHKILTSRGIQKRYAEVVKRRKNIDIKSEYVLIGDALCKHDVNIMQTSCEHDARKSTQRERKEKGKETESESEGEAPAEIISFPSENLKQTFERMKTALLMSDHEINATYAVCSEPDKLAEAVQCALEYDADLREKQTALNNPGAYIRSCYGSGKISAKTRYQKGDNRAPPAAKKDSGTFREAWEEIKEEYGENPTFKLLE